MSARTAGGNKVKDQDFGNMPAGPSSIFKQCREGLNTNHAFIRCVGLPVPNNGLNVLGLIQCGWHEDPQLIGVHLALTNKQAEAESNVATIYMLEAHVQNYDIGSDATGAACVKGTRAQMVGLAVMWHLAAVYQQVQKLSS